MSRDSGFLDSSCAMYDSVDNSQEQAFASMDIVSATIVPSYLRFHSGRIALVHTMYQDARSDLTVDCMRPEAAYSACSIGLPAIGRTDTHS